jgi:hypothetical protein
VVAAASPPADDDAAYAAADSDASVDGLTPAAISGDDAAGSAVHVAAAAAYGENLPDSDDELAGLITSDQMMN